MSTLTTHSNNSLPNSARASRIVVVGVGSFGLHTVTLLLPRLEVLAQFSAPGRMPTPLVRCGLVREDSQVTQHLTIEPSTQQQGFAHVGELQQGIFGTGQKLVDGKILNLLKIEDSNWSSTSHDQWLRGLIRPTLVDVQNYHTSVAHVHVQIVSCYPLQNQACELAEALQQLRNQGLPLSINLVLYIGSEGGLTPSYQQASDAIHNLTGKVDRLLLVDHTKRGKTLVDGNGEVALAACNYLDAQICSTLADTIEHHTPPHRGTRFYSFGAARLYVPVAEMYCEVINQTITETIHKHLVAGAISPPQNAERHCISPENICQDALTNTPIRVGSRWRVRASQRAIRIIARFGIRFSPRPPMPPSLMLQRDQWRTRLREGGGRHNVQCWWQTLIKFDDRIRSTQLDQWQQTLKTNVSQSFDLQDKELKRFCAELIAQRPSGIRQAQGLMRHIKPSFNETKIAISGWDKRENQRAALTPVAEDKQIEDEKQKLVEAMKSLPYKAAIIARMLFIWLTLIFLIGVVMFKLPEIQIYITPLPGLRLQVTPGLAAALVTITLTALCVVWIRLSGWRVRWHQRQIERIFLRRIDREIERRCYSEQAAGVLITHFNQYFDQIFDKTTALQNVLDDAADKLCKPTVADVKLSEHLLYQPIGSESVRAIFHQVLASTTLPNEPWPLVPEQVGNTLDDADKLESYIYAALREFYAERYLNAAREQANFQLGVILQDLGLREHDLRRIIDDLRLRAKPLLDVLPGAMQEDEFGIDTLCHITVESHLVQRVSELGQSNRMVFVHPSCDPFGLSSLMLVGALDEHTLEAPVATQGGTNP